MFNDIDKRKVGELKLPFSFPVKTSEGKSEVVIFKTLKKGLLGKRVKYVFSVARLNFQQQIKKSCRIFEIKKMVAEFENKRLVEEQTQFYYGP